MQLIVTNSHSELEIRYVCQGEKITLSCLVNGTKLIWRSLEFIGTGGRDLELGPYDVSRNIFSFDYNTTVAKLYAAIPFGHTYILKANLTLLVSSEGHILCLSDTNDVKLNTMILICK